MDLKTEDNFDKGSYANLFRWNGKAIKLFKKKDPDLCFQRYQPKRDEDEISRAVFKAEKEAYELIRQNASLRTHAPAYHGVAAVQRVLGPGDSDESGAYLMDCALELDFVDETFRKVAGRTDPDLVEVIRMFNDAGVHYTDDASFCRHKGLLILIDFATKNAQDELENRYMGFGGGAG